MNTETLNTLKLVREGINAVQQELAEPALTFDEKMILGSVLLNLNKQEDILINQVLQAMANKVAAENEKLEGLIADMEAASERLARFSNTIKKISNGLATLAEITTKAISAGLL